MMMTSRTRTSLAVLVLATALAGCAGKSAPQVVLATGQTIKAAGGEFLQTAQLFDQLYRDRKMAEATYDEWRKFSPRFQQGYAAAFATWKAAVGSMDRGGAAQALDAVDALRAQLLALALGVSPALTVKPPGPTSYREDERVPPRLGDAIAAAVAGYRPLERTVAGGQP